MNVAAYCRVSTDNDDQMNSLANQTSFFNEYIQRNRNWNLVRIYSDEGVSGTSVAKRVQFNSMIQDAMDGKIDLIITKEVSRFARNTVDTLNYTRELRRHNVGVYFINDNINTLDSDGEFRLSIMASVAQEESRKTSARVKWGMKRQMEKGYVFSPPIIGYDIHDGQLVINESEAEIVRKIYDLYVNHNVGTFLIAKTLAAENIPLVKRMKCWSPTTVMRILKNEKYVGDLIQQKTIVTDFLTHKSVENKGDKLVFHNHHEPIIDRATWDEAQRIAEARNAGIVDDNPANHSNKYWCSGKIQCGICKGTCVTKTKKALYGTIRIYRCKHTTYYENGKGGCTNTSFVDERILCAAMQFVVKKLTLNAKDIEKSLLELLDKSNAKDDLSSKIEVLDHKLDELNQKKKKTLSLLVDEVITPEDYKELAKDIDLEILNIKSDISNLKKEAHQSQESQSQIMAMLSQMKKYLEQTEPTKQLYSEILEKIVMYGDNHLDIYLIGIPEPFSVQYSREGRGALYRVYCSDFNHNITG